LAGCGPTGTPRPVSISSQQLWRCWNFWNCLLCGVCPPSCTRNTNTAFYFWQVQFPFWVQIFSTLLSISVIQDHYFFGHLSFVTSRRCSDVRVGGRKGGLGWHEKRADRMRQPTVVR